MQLTEEQARQRWCPMVRVEGSNRLHNTMKDGFSNADMSYRCIAGACMAWREFQISYAHGEGPKDHRGYCGFAGSPTGLG